MFMRTSKRAAILIVLVAAAWIALFYGARGVLVWQRADADDHVLSCWYLTATGVEKRRHLYTESGFIGSSQCERMIQLR